MLHLLVLAAASAARGTAGAPPRDGHRPRLFVPGNVFSRSAVGKRPQNSSPSPSPSVHLQWLHWTRGDPVEPRARNIDLAVEFYQSAGVQKTLELAVIAVFGFWLRAKLSKEDADVVQKLLLTALVPAVTLTSLCSVKVGVDSLGYLAGGLGLVLLQIAVAHIVSNTVFGFDPKKMTKKALDLRRTAAMEMGTMAPALSVFAFVTEFVGPAFTGLAALIDLPCKAYMLIFMPSVLKAKASRVAPEAPAASGSAMKALAAQLQDPFNASIIAGVLLSVLFQGGAIAKLGFVGSALKSLAAAQTPVLFLLIGLKLSIEGATPTLCGVLLLLRQGLVMMAVKTFLLFSGIRSPQMQLLITLASQAATSVVGFGQINKAKDRGDEGYSTDFAFDIIGISFPLTIILNTAACLGGQAYIANMYRIGVTLIALSGLLYTACRNTIVDALRDTEDELPLKILAELPLQVTRANKQLSNVNTSNAIICSE